MNMKVPWNPDCETLHQTIKGVDRCGAVMPTGFQKSVLGYFFRFGRLFQFFGGSFSLGTSASPPSKTLQKLPSLFQMPAKHFKIFFRKAVCVIFAEDDNIDSANDQLTRLKRSLSRKRNWRRSQRRPTYLKKQEYTFAIL